MSCECYQIGGRFIAEDPDCPAHGTEAQRLQAEAEEESRLKDEKILALEARVAELEHQLYLLTLTV